MEEEEEEEEGGEDFTTVETSGMKPQHSGHFTSISWTNV